MDELAALAAANSTVAEVAEMLYMIERPAVLDSGETRRLLGVEATPIEEVVAEIVANGGVLDVTSSIPQTT